jgi:undecaprenyl-diphosphatase
MIWPDVCPPFLKFSMRVMTWILVLGFSTATELKAADVTIAESSIAPPKLTLFQAVVLGFVEGATEYLPVSSTGHLLIVQHLLGMDGSDEQAEAAHSLAICIQCGAILAVVVLYFGRIRQIIRGMMGKDADGLRLLFNLMIAFMPAAVIGLLFNKWIKQHLFGVLPVAAALFVGGVIILLQTLRRPKASPDTGKEIAQMSWSDALFVGIVQCLAFWPGFSRSLATILGCRFAGVRMTASVEFSFLLGLITLTAATAYEGLKNGESLIANYGATMPLISLVTAFIAAVISVRFMVNALGRFGLAPFGYYRIALAFVCIVWLID